MISTQTAYIVYFLWHFSDVFSQCGKRPLEVNFNRVPLIVNGRLARYGEIPWHAGLFYSGQYYCGGALIHKKFILTAGHCAESATDVVNLKIRLGEYDLNSDQPKPHVEKGVIKKIIHEQFQRYPTPIFDIALLELDSEVTFEDSIQPICLPTDGDPCLSQMATVCGWGRNASDGVISPILQMVDLPIITNGQCQEWVNKKSTTVIRDDCLCAGYEMGGKDACTGDSGGPLFIRKANGDFCLTAITSAGFGCAQAYLPGVYTRLSHYFKWVEQNIQVATNAIPLQRMLQLLVQSAATRG